MTADGGGVRIARSAETDSGFGPWTTHQVFEGATPFHQASASLLPDEQVAVVRFEQAESRVVGRVLSASGDLTPPAAIDLDVPADWVDGAWVDVAATAGQVVAVVTVPSADATTAPRVWVSRLDLASNTWDQPVDLVARVGGAVEAWSGVLAGVAAEGSHVAVAWRLPTAGQPDMFDHHVMRSDDAGATWTHLDVVSSSATYPKQRPQVAWRGETVALGWLAKAPDGATLTLRANATGSAWTAEPSREVPGTSTYERELSLLAGRWALVTSSRHAYVLDPAGWTHVSQAAGVRSSFSGDRFVGVDDGGTLHLHTLDTTSPQLDVLGVSSPQRADQEVSAVAKDAGGVRTLRCLLDDVEFASSGSRCSVPTPVTTGDHTLQVDVTDNAGLTATRSTSWLADGELPTVRWTSVPRRWNLHQDEYFRWHGSDHVTGLKRYVVSSVWSWTDRTGTYRRDSSLGPTVERGLAWVGTGETRCLRVRAVDRVDNSSPLSSAICVVGPLDDTQAKPSAQRHIQRVPSRYYLGDGGTLLKYGGATLSTSSVSPVTDVAVRAKTCPTCGTMSVYFGTQAWKVNLRSSRSTLKVIDLPFKQAFKPGQLKVRKTSSGTVIIDAFYLRTAAPW
ncbi:MAG: hypothetical protein ACRDO1_09725 [Nocardioidaceae bacterium]